jgi:hypothetical protein
MSRMNQLWMATVVMWLIAVGLTCWNVSTIEAVALARDQNERLRKEMMFHRQYISKLESVRQTADTFFLPVDSLKLGFLGVQSELQSLAAVFGLENFKITRQMGQATPEQLPLTVAFEGTLEGVMQFLFSLREYPYLPIDHTRIKLSMERGAEVTIDLALQFRLNPMEGFASPPLQTTRYLLPSEGSPS